VKKVIVVGAGIAGLGAAYALQKQGIEVLVLESQPDPGGRMRSRQWRGAWLDLGGESLSSKDTGLMDLVSELGLDHRKQDYYGGDLAFEVWRGNRAHRISFSRPMSFLTSTLFSLGGKLGLARLLPDYIKQTRRNEPSGSDAYEPWRGAWADDESIESWLSRRSPELLEYFAEPLFEYMCGYRPDEISKGWFLYGMTKHQNVRLLTFDEGLGLVTRTLAQRVDVETGARVTRVAAGKSPVTVEWIQEGRTFEQEGDAVVVAVPGSKVLNLVEELDPERRRFFESVRYTPHDLPYFALSGEMEDLPALRYYPRKENRYITSIGYDGAPTNPNVKFLRVFMKTGRILRLMDKSDGEVFREIEEQVSRYFPKAVARIDGRFVSRWREGLPLFYPGYLRALDRFRQLPPLRGIAFAGDYLAFASTGAAYQSGQRAASEILDQVS
jgi:oxygen-dependent protoporphyrinogen oxidase